MLLRSGYPTTTPFWGKKCSVSGNVTKTASANRPISLFSFPGTAFCSCMKIRTPLMRSFFRMDAAIRTGAATYPPVPTIRCGRKRSRIKRDWMVPVKRFVRKRAIAGENLPGYPVARTNRIGIPSRGTTSSSTLPLIPTNRNRVEVSLKIDPIASAGLTCPAVPPPVSRTRLICCMLIVSLLIETPTVFFSSRSFWSNNKTSVMYQKNQQDTLAAC